MDTARELEQLHARAPRLTAVARRQAIIDAARTVFARHGYHGAGTADIARECGCSEPVLYKHFRNKRALFAAVLENCAVQTAAALPDVTRSDVPLDDLVRRAERIIRQPMWAELSQLRLLALSLADDPEIAGALQRVLERMQSTIAGSIRRAQELGQARADVDADHIGWLWVGMTMTSSVRHSLYGKAGLDGGTAVARQLIDLIRIAPQED